MNSQVSFKFDGEHNKQPIISILGQRLEGLKYKIETNSNNIYRIYVASMESKEKTLNVCRGIQSNAIFDFNREV